MIITPRQVAHLKQHEELVQEHQLDPNLTVERWVDEAEEDAPYEAYFYMCHDIEIRPLRPWPA